MSETPCVFLQLNKFPWCTVKENLASKTVQLLLYWFISIQKSYADIHKQVSEIVEFYAWHKHKVSCNNQI